MISRCSVDEIIRTTSRLPFNQNHIQFILSLAKKQNAKGLDVRFHPGFTKSPEDVLARMEDGIFILACPQIEADFVFVHENGGRGLFGGQKSSFRVFTGSFADDDFTAGASFKLFGIAATSINNIFRHEGLLDGAV